MTEEFVILNENKEPIHKFKSGGKAWTEVKDEPNIARIVPEGWVVLDFDTETDARIMKAIVFGMDLPVRMMQTTRGIHVWFKVPQGMTLKNGIKQRLAIGIYADRKSGGRNAYVKIRDHGVDREWIKAIPYEDCMFLPKWLLPITGVKSDGFGFRDWKKGDGRNQGLFNYVLYLQSKGFLREEVRETIRVINQYVFAEPLPDEEMDKILRDEAFTKTDAEIRGEASTAAAARGFSHNTFGDELISMYHIITYNGTVYIYDDGYYQSDEHIVENKMIEQFPGIKQRQRAEVMSYIKIKTHVPAGDLRFDPWTVNIKSGRFNLLTMTLSQHTPGAIEFDRVPVNYDPDAYSPELDHMLDKVFCHDADVRKLFEEMVGYSLMRHLRYQKGFMFYGSGANGKSTILDLIKAFLGHGNYVSIDLDDLTKGRFNAAELENKLANIGDDLNNTRIENTGDLKRILAGNAMQVERKSERPFQLEQYATQIFSANAIPRTSDNTFGFYRRWCFIPLNATFTKDDADFDPGIKDKITTPTALSYLFNLALKGARRLIQNNGFTEPAVVTEALKQYQTENNHVLSWIFENEIEISTIVSKTRKELFENYKDWCVNSGITSPGSAQNFYREIKSAFGVDVVRRSGNRWYFVIPIDLEEES